MRNGMEVNDYVIKHLLDVPSDDYEYFSNLDQLRIMLCFYEKCLTNEHYDGEAAYIQQMPFFEKVVGVLNTIFDETYHRAVGCECALCIALERAMKTHLRVCQDDCCVEKICKLRGLFEGEKGRAAKLQGMRHVCAQFDGNDFKHETTSLGIRGCGLGTSKGRQTCSCDKNVEVFENSKIKVKEADKDGN